MRKAIFFPDSSLATVVPPLWRDSVPSPVPRRRPADPRPSGELRPRRLQRGGSRAAPADQGGDRLGEGGADEAADDVPGLDDGGAGGEDELRVALDADDHRAFGEARVLQRDPDERRAR